MRSGESFLYTDPKNENPLRLILFDLVILCKKSYFYGF